MIIFIPGRNWSGKVRMRPNLILPDSFLGRGINRAASFLFAHRVAAWRI
jgi:hypothetical protein